MIAIDLSKQYVNNKHLILIQKQYKINFTGNLNGDENVSDNTIMLFITKEAKESILDFSRGTVKVL